MTNRNDEIQKLLCTSVLANDLELFNLALDKGADPNLKCDDSFLSVFELCCQRPGSASFISEILEWTERTRDSYASVSFLLFFEYLN